MKEEEILRLNQPKSNNLKVVIIDLPSSKSISNRVLIINALGYSSLPIDNLSICEDTDNLKRALYSNSNKFYTGDGGTTIRFLTAFLSRIVGEWIIECSERMKQRPISVLVDTINKMGGQIQYLEKEGYPPLKILGSNLTRSEIKISGSVSSQYISALLMIAPSLTKGLKLELEGKIVSHPYIDMTLRIMEEFGVKYQFEGNVITIRPQTYKPILYKVENDWSAASYWYEMLSFSKGTETLFLKGLNRNSIQGDAKQVKLWRYLGIKTTFQKEGIILSKITEEAPKRLDIDFVDMPDLVQTFAVTCVMKGIPFCFKGVETLKIKETNRVLALINELAKLGYRIYEPSEGQLVWTGETIKADINPLIETYQDHRMAMAFAPIALLHPIRILNPSVVKKSYPNFWKHLKKIGILSV